MVPFTRRHRKPHKEFKRRTPPGAPAGSVVSAPGALQPRIQVFSYGADDLEERTFSDTTGIPSLLGARPVLWINVDGVGDAETIQRIGEMFGLHPLAQEDVAHVHQRAKVEDYEQNLFIVARMMRLRNRGELNHEDDAPDELALDTEQVSLFLGRDFVLTFQEEAGIDCFGPVRDRLRKPGSKLRQLGADWLAHALLDAVTDSYFPIIETYSDELDQLDEALEEGAPADALRRIHRIRRELLILRRSAWPLREVFQNLQRETHALISPEARVYLRDCYDHSVQIIDVLETYRELCADLREHYFSTIGQRTNAIMKVLTIIATIFIPLSFVVGVWGMNFDTSVSKWNMPELEWEYGYPFAWGVILAIAGGLMCYFWRKGWLSR